MNCETEEKGRGNLVTFLFTDYSREKTRLDNGVQGQNEGQAERDREKNREVKNRNIQRDRMYRTGIKKKFDP